MIQIGKEVKRSLVIIPATVKVREDWYYTYACETCKNNNIEVPILSTPKETPFIEGSYATPEAVAYLMLKAQAEEVVMEEVIYE